MRNIIKNVIKTFGVGRRKDVKIVWTKLEAGNERSVHKETVPNKSEISYGMRVTPENVTSLAANEIFVFGSNMRGCHDGGASECAKLYFGAIDGQAEGPQGAIVCYTDRWMWSGRNQKICYELPAVL